MDANTITILVTIVLYLSGMVAIGAMFTKKNKSTSDFYLGGRSGMGGKQLRSRPHCGRHSKILHHQCGEITAVK